MVALNVAPHPRWRALSAGAGSSLPCWVAWLGMGRAYDWNLFGEGVEEYRRVAVAGLVAVGS